ncbi:MAG: hypothetical protein IID36_10155, partial [Planctomycetes bacterium]|nr:hypothetical protein [Planctomycetota bacterium]
RRGGESAATAGAGPHAPSLLPYPPLRMITVQATEEDMAEIEELIAILDVPGSEKFETVTLANSDANAVAGTLEQMFAGASRGRGRGGATVGTTGPRFIGEDGGNVLFFSAPLGMHDDIRDAIKTIEESGQEATTPRPIILEYATPTDVASAIQDAYGGGGGSRGSRRSGRSGRTNARFTISGHDASKRLFVLTSDDETFADIERLAKSLDKPAEMGFEMRIIPFKHASARAVHEMLTKLVKDYLGRIRGSGGSVEPFAAEVDEKTNSMIILGGPTVFEFIQNAIAVVDIPANRPPKPGFLMIALKNADAQEVATNINNVWGKKKARAGEDPPHAEANRQLNILIVHGTEAQVSEIKTQFIDPLEEHKPPELLTETVTLQYAQAELVAESIQRIFEDKKRAFDAIKGRGFKVSPVEVTVVVTPDVNTNQVIIQASEKNMALAKARIVELDKEDIAANTATRMEVYRVKYADPNSVASIINQWAQARTQAGGRGGARRVAARDTVKAIAEPATQSVIVNASNSNHELVAQLLAELDDETFAKSRSRHVLTLKHASANDLANQFRAVFQQRGGRRRGDQGPAFVASPSLNAIVANLNEEELVEITELLAVLDAEPGLDAERTVEVYSLRYSDPGSINSVIMNMFRGDRRSQGSPAEQVTSAVDWGTRSVIVTASAKNHVVIAKLIEKTDVESTIAKRVHFVELSHANAQDVANAVNNVVRSRRRTQRGEVPVTVTPEMATNSLIIYASDEEMEDLRDLIEKIDVEPGIDTLRTMVAYSLKYADPNAIVNAINQTFRGGGRRTQPRPEEQVNVVNEWSTQSVIVTASAKNHEKIKKLIAEVDIEGPFKKETKLVTLKNANAQDIANTLSQIVRSRRRGRRGEQAITIVPDVGTNALVVFASQSEMEDLQPLIDSLDVKPDAARERKVQSFSLAYAHPGSVQQAINSLFRTTGRANPRDQVSAVPEWGGNGVIVSASPENMAKVAELIEQLDQRGDRQREVHVIQIEYADPGDVAQVLDEMYVRTQPRGRGQQEAPVTITALPGSKAVLVKAGGADLEQIMATIEKIDTEEVGGGGEIRVVTLLYSDAQEILTAIEEYLRKPNAASSRGGRGRRGGRRRVGGSGGELLGDVRLSLLTQSNSIVVSGDLDRVEDVEAQIIDMDEANKDFAKPKFIFLKHAKAVQIVPMVEQMVSGNTGSNRRGGRGSRGRGGATQGVTVMAHEMLNALIVRGGPADIANVEAIVEGLDVPEAKSLSTIKVIQVSAALNVTDLALQVEGVINDGQAALEDQYPGMTIGRIMITPDRRGSAVILAGSPALFSDAEQLIRELEGTGPKGGIKTIILDPPPGMSPEEFKTLLEQLTEDAGGGSGARRGSARGSRNTSRGRTGGRGGNRSSGNRRRR